MCPDYWIHIRSLLSERDIVLATGEAVATSMTLPGGHLRLGRLLSEAGGVRVKSVRGQQASL